MLGERKLQDGCVGQFDGRGQRLFEVLRGGPIRADERRGVKLERQAIRLRQVRLGGLDVTERVVGRPFSALRQGQVVGQPISAQTHAAFWRQVGPERGDRGVDVGRSISRQDQLVAVHLGQLGNLLRQQDFQEATDGPHGHQEDE